MGQIRNTKASEGLIGDYLILYSYNTAVAAMHATTGATFRTDKKYSVTITRQTNAWLKDKAEAQTVAQWVINEMAEGETNAV